MTRRGDGTRRPAGKAYSRHPPRAARAEVSNSIKRNGKSINDFVAIINGGSFVCVSIISNQLLL